MSYSIRRCLAASFMFIVFLLLSGRVHAQSQVQGTVTAAPSGEPLTNVQVYVARLKRGTVTDDTGTYALTGLAPGTYDVTFSGLGYEKRVRSLTVPEDTRLTLDIQLIPQTLEAGEIVIVADNPRQTAAVPLPTLSVNKVDRIERGRLSLWEDLDQWPGMARSTNGPGIERPYIRGLSAGRILLLMQHLPYAYQTWDPEAGLATDGNGTEEVDVIQGPATLRYGPGAMGGIINLVPEYPAATGHTEGSYTGGLYANTEGLYSELALKQTNNQWFWGARAGFDTNADYKAGGDFEREEEGREIREEEKGRVPNSRYDHVQGQVFTGMSRDWGSTRLTYQFLQHRNGIVEAEEEEEEAEGEEEGEREIGPPYHALRDHFLTSDTQLQVGRGWLNGVLGVQVNQQQEFEPEEEVEFLKEEEGETAIDLNLTTFHYRFDYEVPLAEALSFTSGLQGYFQHNESKGREPFIPNADRRQLGAFGLLTWHPGKMVVEGGVRYDAQSLETSPAEGEEEEFEEGGGEEAEIKRTFGLPSGSVGATYQAGDGQYVKVNIGVGNRAPETAELTANGLLREVRRFLIGDESLDAEYNAEGDVTLGWRFPVATVSLGGFYNRIYNYTYLLATDETERSFPVYRYRQGDSDFWGGHAGITLHPAGLGGLRLFSRFDLVLAALNDAPGYDLPMIPAPHLLSGVELGGLALGPLQQVKVRAELDTYFEQSRVAPGEAPSDGYSLVNLSLNTQVPWGTRTVLVGLHGLNLFDTQYISHLSLLKPEGIPNLGRSITLSALVPFGW